METGKNTISDPAMGVLFDHSEADKFHNVLLSEHTE